MLSFVCLNKTNSNSHSHSHTNSRQKTALPKQNSGYCGTRLFTQKAKKNNLNKNHPNLSEKIDLVVEAILSIHYSTRSTYSIHVVQDPGAMHYEVEMGQVAQVFFCD